MVFCFCLSFAQLDNSFLDLMFRHTYSQEKMNSYSSNNSSNNLFWYENNTLLDKLKTYSANFKEFSMENLNKSGVKFVLLPSDEILTKNEIELNASNGEFTWLYKNGVADYFVPPSVPGVPSTVNRSFDKISLEWSEPEYGIQNLTNYTVAYQRVDEKVWKETHSKESTLHLNDLESDTTFCFKVTANFANGTSMTNKSNTY